MMRVSVAGGSGYVGGELLRLLLRHPEVELSQVTSERHAGRFIHRPHPNLRGLTTLRFVPLAELEPCDVLFAALPHGEAARRIRELNAVAGRIVDCSADFRLRDGAAYERWYGAAHPAPEWLDRFVYGLPELQREVIRGARFASGVGCNATAVSLALLPLTRAGLVDAARGVVAEVKVGSSEGGRVPGAAGHHPERSGAVRSYAPVGHRHTAEVRAATGLQAVHLSVTAVEAVRGALATCHVFPPEPVGEKALWGAFREHCGDEPFLRIVHERGGLHRHPEPKIVCGTNFADVGWALDAESGRIVTLCALDNLVKGAAGNAVQCMNLMCGFAETAGLGFPGLHPL